MADSLTSYALLGFKVTPTTKEQLLDFVAGTTTSDRIRILASQNLHGFYMFLTDEKFRSLHEDNRTCVHIDGMPIIWMGRLLGLPLHIKHRTATNDWIMPLMQIAACNGLRVYYLGSEPEVCEEGLSRIREKFPGINIMGHHGFFDAEANNYENRAIVDEINAFRSNILIVGMGMGRQEGWIFDNLHNLKVNCIVTCGACMEYIVGKLPIPAHWVGLAGIERVYRLWHTPRRLGWRYLVEPWLVAWLLLRNQLRLRLNAWRSK